MIFSSASWNEHWEEPFPMNVTTPLLSESAGPTAPPLLEGTIGDNLLITIAAHGDRDALIVPFENVHMTYNQFGDAVDELSLALMAAGIEVGDRVGIWSPNCTAWVLTQFATAQIGAILVCVNPAYRTHELRYALGQSGCRMLIAATDFKTSDYVAMVGEVRDDLSDLEQVVFLDTSDWDELLTRAGETSADALAERSSSLSPDDPINIQYTSGTKIGRAHV